MGFIQAWGERVTPEWRPDVVCKPLYIRVYVCVCACVRVRIPFNSRNGSVVLYCTTGAACSDVAGQILVLCSTAVAGAPKGVP